MLYFYYISINNIADLGYLRVMVILSKDQAGLVTRIQVSHILVIQVKVVHNRAGVIHIQAVRSQVIQAILNILLIMEVANYIIKEEANFIIREEVDYIIGEEVDYITMVEEDFHTILTHQGLHMAGSSVMLVLSYLLQRVDT